MDIDRELADEETAVDAQPVPATAFLAEDTGPLPPPRRATGFEPHEPGH
jgi:hypothetical protein